MEKKEKQLSLGLYSAKLNQLNTLFENLVRQKEVLAWKDGKTATDLAIKNAKLISSLEELDKKISIMPESIIASKEIITLNEQIYKLLDKIRELFEEIQPRYVKEKDEIKKEYMLASAKRQLHVSMFSNRFSSGHLLKN